MPGFDIVDIVHQHYVQFFIQRCVVDNDAVINFGQFQKIAVNNAVEGVLVTPKNLGSPNLLQPAEQLMGQLLLPPFD